MIRLGAVITLCFLPFFCFSEKTKNTSPVLDAHQNVIALERDGISYTVLNSLFYPYVVFGNGKFYQVDSQWTELEFSEVGGLTVIDPEKKTRLESYNIAPHAESVIYHYLADILRDQRPQSLKHMDLFLAHARKNLTDPKKDFGLTHGATLVSPKGTYRILGERYSKLLEDGSGLFWRNDEGDEIHRVNISDNGEMSLMGISTEKIKDDSWKSKVLLYLADNTNLSSPQSSYKQSALKRALENRRVILDYSSPGMKSLFSKPYVDENGKALSQEALAKRIVNYFFNWISESSQASPVEARPVNESSLSADIDNFVSPIRRARLMSSNPYACQDPLKEPMRLDWLASHVLYSDKVYRELEQLSDNRKELESKDKIEFGIKPKTKDNLNVAVTDSAVSVDGRVVHRLPEIHGDPWYESIDFGKREKKVGAVAMSTDPRTVTHKAGEFIQIKKNGFLKFAIYDAKGNALPLASDDIVVDSESHVGQLVHNPASCLGCHSNGLRSVQDDSPVSPAKLLISEKEFAGIKRLVDEFETYSSYQKFISDHYNEPEEFLPTAKKDNARYQTALKKAAAFIALPKSKNHMEPILPQIAALYTQPLSLEDMAKELGITETVLRENKDKVNSALWWAQLKSFHFKDSMPRNIFEQIYCRLKNEFSEKNIPSNPRTPRGTTHD